MRRRFALVPSRLHADTSATVATEYLLLLAGVVLPLALLVPLWLSMIRMYTARLVDGAVSPFP